MSGAELALGIVGAVDVCFRYGQELVKTCHAAKNADSLLAEASLRVEACWTRIYSQLSVLRNIEALLDEQHRDLNLQILDVLMNKLRAADSKLTRLSQQNDDQSGFELKAASVKARKAKFALQRGGLADVIKELEDWQAVFDPTWFLIMKMATVDIDTQLEVAARTTPAPLETSQSAIPTARFIRHALRPAEDGTKAARPKPFLQRNGLVPGSREVVEFSPVSTATRLGHQQWVLLDPIACMPRSAANAVLKDGRSLTQKLRRADPFAFGLLECKGMLQEDVEGPINAARALDQVSQLSFVFRLPQNCTQVQSIRKRLSGEVECEYGSLTNRIDLAKQLVRAVSYVHIYDFVHKNIRPDTIVVLRTCEESAGGKPNIDQARETAVLVGFEGFRSADGKTHRMGDDHWEKNIYRHPSRQGLRLEVDYDMRHDIYSVGVCLLEIGLWQSFVTYDERKSGRVPLLGPGFEDGNMDLVRDPLRVKEQMLHLARGKLKRSVGTRYSQVVETCLTCLDDDNADFGNDQDFEDEDGIVVGARYIEKVVAKLSDIVV